MELPNPMVEGPLAVETAIANRRSIREFAPDPLTPDSLGQLLWAGYGITEGAPWHRRTAPSAGAVFPLDIYVVAGNVEDLLPGVYHYTPLNHSLEQIEEGDLREDIANVCFEQEWMATAPAMVVVTAEFERASSKYEERGVAYAFIEAGHVGQNLYLQAESLGMGICEVGAFKEEELMDMLELPYEHKPLYIAPFGWKA